MTTVWVGFFARTGAERDRLQDSVMVGSMIGGSPSSGPMMFELDTNLAPVMAVLDGVGGHAGGHVASRSAGHHVADLIGEVRVPADLRDLLVETCRRITDESATVQSLEQMGTTIAGVWFSAGDVTFFNVGDSRVYLERDGYLTQCTIDDVVDLSDGAPLSQCLGAGFRHIEPHVTTISWPDRGVALLCTDGFDRRLTLADMERAIRSANPIQSLWDLADGADDDASVILIDGRYVEPAAAEPHEALTDLFLDTGPSSEQVRANPAAPPPPLPTPPAPSPAPPPEAPHVRFDPTAEPSGREPGARSGRARGRLGGRLRGGDRKRPGAAD